MGEVIKGTNKTFLKNLILIYPEICCQKLLLCIKIPFFIIQVKNLKNKKKIIIKGTDIKKLVEMTNMKFFEFYTRLHKALELVRVFNILRNIDLKEGDSIIIRDHIM